MRISLKIPWSKTLQMMVVDFNLTQRWNLELLTTIILLIFSFHELQFFWLLIPITHLSQWKQFFILHYSYFLTFFRYIFFYLKKWCSWIYKCIKFLFKIQTISLKYLHFQSKQAETWTSLSCKNLSCSLSATSLVPSHLYRSLHRQCTSRMQFLASWNQNFKVDFCCHYLFVNALHKPESKICLKV